MESQVLKQEKPGWAAYGLVLLILSIAVTAAVIKDVRLSKMAGDRSTNESHPQSD